VIFDFHVEKVTLVTDEGPSHPPKRPIYIINDNCCQNMMKMVIETWRME